jgi:hypothetical protein
MRALHQRECDFSPQFVEAKDAAAFTRLMDASDMPITNAATEQAQKSGMKKPGKPGLFW